MSESILKTLESGNVKITWLRDNAQDRLMPVNMFDGNGAEIAQSLNLNNGIPSSMSAFLVETEGKRLLFDAGLGIPGSLMMKALTEYGVKPEQIDYIFITHFHMDHIGGMMNGDAAVFPNAQVYVAKEEYDGWMQMNDESKAPVVKMMDLYKGRVTLFEFSNGEAKLPCGVLAIKAAGHTPGHTVYQIGKFLIIGDIMHGSDVQMKNPDICAVYDMNKAEAIASRKRIINLAKENHLTMAGMHLPTPSFI